MKKISFLVCAAFALLGLSGCGGGGGGGSSSANVFDAAKGFKLAIQLKTGTLLPKVRVPNTPGAYRQGDEIDETQVTSEKMAGQSITLGVANGATGVETTVGLTDITIPGYYTSVNYMPKATPPNPDLPALIDVGKTLTLPSATPPAHSLAYDAAQNTLTLTLSQFNLSTDPRQLNWGDPGYQIAVVPPGGGLAVNHPTVDNTRRYVVKFTIQPSTVEGEWGFYSETKLYSVADSSAVLTSASGSGILKVQRFP